MRRYMVFAGYGYYPNGGAHDWKTSDTSLNEAILKAKAHKPKSGDGWCHVFDTRKAEIVWEMGG